jgi:hypothetical protein
MAQYAQDFNTQSQGLLNYIQSQIANAVSWQPLPGQLNKIVASSGGFVWGFNVNGDVYTCKEPCDGQNWRYVPPPPERSGMPFDIAVDNLNVYILYNAALPQPPNPPAPASGYLSGPWIAGKSQVLKEDVDEKGNIVNISFEPPYTKMVRQKDGVGKYYTGPITDYSPKNWPTYNTVPSGSYNLTLTDKPSSGGFKDEGCWNDRGARAISGGPQQYGYTPETCLKEAKKNGSTFFALQDGGWCTTSKAGDDYTKYGKASTSTCPTLGGAWINHVYSVEGGTPPPAPPAPKIQLCFSMRSIDGGGDWTAPQVIPGNVPVNPTLNLTNQFMFVGNQGCSKPCTTNSWVPINEPPGSMGIVASSDANTYAIGKSSRGSQSVYQSSANAQGGWTEQPGLSGITPIAAEADSKFILGVNQASQRPVRCSPPYTDADSCQNDNSIKYTPMPGVHTMSLNPRSYQTYIAATTSGPSGNIFQRVDPGTIDYSGAHGEINEYTTKMDSNVNSLGAATGQLNSEIEVAKVKMEANKVIKEITDINEERQSTAMDREKTKRKIETIRGSSATWKMHILQTLALTLAAVILSYFVLGFVLPPTLNMIIATVGMSVGVGFAIYFAVNKQ